MNEEQAEQIARSAMARARNYDLAANVEGPGNITVTYDDDYTYTVADGNSRARDLDEDGALSLIVEKLMAADTL